MFKVASTASSRSEGFHSSHRRGSNSPAESLLFFSRCLRRYRGLDYHGRRAAGGARCAMDRLLLPSLAHQCTITVQAMSLCARFLTSPRGGAKIRNTGAECEIHGPIGDGAPVINLAMLLSRRRRVSIAGLEP